VALALPFTPAAALLGFVPLPGVFFVFLTAVTVMYLALVEVVKRRLFAPRMEAA
jgi:Mg2+-importing ATPase